MNDNGQLSVPDWNQIMAVDLLGEPQVIDHESGPVVKLHTSQSDLFLSCYAFGIRIRSAFRREPDYALIQTEAVAQRPRLRSCADGFLVETDDLCIELQQQPLAFKVSKNTVSCESPRDGHFVRERRVPPLAKTQEGWCFAMDLQSQDRVYGFGEKWGRLDKRGQLLRSFNSDALGVNAEISYKNTPFCWTTSGWSVLVNTPAPVTHGVGFAMWSHRSYIAMIEDHHLDVFLLLADENVNVGAQLIKQYSELTGFVPMPPLWSTGVILSKAYYRDAQEILAAAHAVRRKNMPCDVITFDGRAWQNTQTRFSFMWDETRYPEPQPVIDELKSLGFKICVWEYPLISTENTEFDRLASKGWLLKDGNSGGVYEFEWDRQAFGDVLTALPRSGMIDFTHPEAYAYWRDAHAPLFAKGVDMIKADFGEQIEDHAVASNGETGKGLHNVYAKLYNQCVFEAAEKYSLSGPFLFSRASWIGCQQYNSQWGGDPQSDWEGMAANLRGGLAWGLSGGPFYATDVGGFYKDRRDDKLYVRWAQAAVFSAHYRLHGIGAREPWTYSKAAEAAVMKALRLRYRLLAYLRVAMQQASEYALPVQRAMVIAFPEQPAAWAFEDQFMFGDDLLVAPCLQADDQIEFYLPEGEWVQFDPDSDRRVSLPGARVVTMQLALDEIAVFARADAQIPLNKAVLMSGELDADECGDITIEQWWTASL